METVQLALADSSYGTALKETLVRNGNWRVQCVDRPDPSVAGVLVVDGATLDYLPVPLAEPERIVFITKNEPQHLARAWDAGIVSVVYDSDPISTAMLAIMAAALRVAKRNRKDTSSGPGSAVRRDSLS